MDKVKIACLGDSPLVHTGFATVTSEIYQGFHEAGFEVHAYGFLHHEEDTDGVLPYNYRPTPHLDDLGHATYGFFLRMVQPDIIFILTDPGNIEQYTHGILTRKQAEYKKDGHAFTPPVICYTPIEGSPSPVSHGQGLLDVQTLGGKVVVYCESAKKAIQKQFPQLKPEVVYHGLDHANFQKYDDADRKLLRKMVGLDDYFVIGSVGVNKRTKGFTTLIYTAQILRRWGQDKDVVFYCHTDPYRDTMWGYKLAELAKFYGVEDMFLWKQELSNDNYWMGTPRDNGTLADVRQLGDKIPNTPQERGYLWRHYDFVAKMNCLDLYADASQIEGWGLCAGEAMACGVPVISVHDGHVRDEIYSDGAYMVDPLPHRCWSTWHSGMRLVEIDPEIMARAIITMKNNPKLRRVYSEKGLAVAGKYRWQDAKEKMSRLVMEVVERDRRLTAEYIAQEEAA